ncbi:MAG: glycosyltransferase family 39 protein, partial [Victivallaceae bacterium]
MKKSRLDPAAQYQLYANSSGDVYYGYPIGTSILSIPAIALSNLIGYKAMLPDGSFSEKNEARIQRCVAALTMILFALILYLTARMILPPVISSVCVLVTILGSQAWSTCSRGAWSHNWLCVMTATVILLLLGENLKKIRKYPIIVGLALGLMFMCRPTAALFIILFMLFIWHNYKFYDFMKCAITAFCCLLLFVLYSFYCFNTPLPPYYM